MDIKGKVAFVTGGATGIGLAIARSFAARGCKIMLADINADLLTNAEQELRSSGADATSVICDVSDAAAVQQAAETTIDRFGKVHIVVNNAGVGIGGRPGQTPLEDWRWIVDINLMGVVHGVEVFTPLMQAHGEGGYFVNTASMAGHVTDRGMPPYYATKFAVVGYSEALKHDLARSDIGVSVLCPAWVQTNIHKSRLASPTGPSSEAELENDRGFHAMKQVVENGLPTALVGDWTADCVEANRFYIFTHPEMQQYIDQRHELIKADYAACAADMRLNEALS
ncbi:SDR family NAD(P)-dependent oxidoreductase [Kordiimonas aquimaris]|uniref:SDR family NAD(P)-dependent oxidoreductase n=1 Tax=Kordiimonas aquimaris TaxID=707591 RepID=UPI0021D349A8|nr:SDR family NAD(P)-dependent oxidoreductase [Kordiimonas aquimaris]